MAKKTATMTEQTPETLEPGIYLADGTFLPGSAGYANGDLWVWPETDQSLVEMVLIFGDPEKTARIMYVITEKEAQTWEGFTRLTTAKVDEDGNIAIRMRKG